MALTAEVLGTAKVALVLRQQTSTMESARAERGWQSVCAGQRHVQPVAALVQVTAHAPEPRQCRAQPKNAFMLPLATRPLQRGAQIVVLTLEPIEPGHLFGAIEPHGGGSASAR